MTAMAAASLPSVLQRAEGVEVIGEMEGSGYRIPPSLVRRADGQTIQLTPLLLAIVTAIDGERSLSEVAATVSETTGRDVSPDNVRQLVESQLRPLGVVVREDGSQPEVRKQSPLLGIKFRYAVTDPERTRKITEPFQFLFRRWAVVPLLLAFVAVCWWVFVRKGLAAATWDAFERPGLLILVFVITILSAGFHEFGHAAAARYGGATPGVMGFGIYLVWPAFYTDVTDSYRLSRWGRLRTDLGGLYFNAIVAVAITGLWSVLRYDALLLIVATQILQMLRQLAPMVRFDGYHVVADITGVPDLYSRIKPTLLGALPWRWGDPEANLLKRWARVVVTAWVLVVVPLLASVMLGAILALPRIMGSAWASLAKQQHVFSAALVDGDMIQAVARVLAMVAIAIPIAGIIYMLVRIMRRTALSTWRSTAGKPVPRALALVCGAFVICGLAAAWWPREGNYLPVRPTEHGAFFNIELMPSVHSTGSRSVGAAVKSDSAQSVLKPGSSGEMRALWDSNSAPPTKKSPKLALILVPRMPTLPSGLVGNGGSAPMAAAIAPRGQGWVFPVDKPLTPGPGDNQALAVNTRDNTVVYDAAFAMVWVTDNSYAQNINDGEAYASCNNCASVAVAYQVVFVIDSDPANDNVATPQNLAGALNYNCVNCMTYGLARQVFITLDKPLSAKALAQLTVTWAEIAAYGYAIEAGLVRPEEINRQLEVYTNRILTIVEEDQPGSVTALLPSATASVSPSPKATATSGSFAPAAATAQPPTSSSGAPTASASSSPEIEATRTPTSSTSTTQDISSPVVSPDPVQEPTTTSSPDATTSNGTTPADSTSSGSVSGTGTDATGDTP